MSIYIPDSNDHVDLPHGNGTHNFNSYTQALTHACWYKHITDCTIDTDSFRWYFNIMESSNDMMTFRYQFAAGLNEIILYLSGDVSGTAGVDYGYCYYVWAPTVNQTYHIAVSKPASGTPTLYIDGSSVSWDDTSTWGSHVAITFNHVNANGVIEIGATDAGGTPKGEVEHWSMWYKALSADEITQIMYHPEWACGQSDCYLYLPLKNIVSAGGNPANYASGSADAPTLYHTPVYRDPIAPVAKLSSPFWHAYTAAAAGDLSPSLNETLTIAESLTIAMSLPGISMVETMTIAEGFTESLPLGTSASDTLTIAELVTAFENLAGVTVTESMVIQEYIELTELSVDKQVVATDTITVAEAITVAMNMFSSLTETITIGEWIKISGLAVGGALRRRGLLMGVYSR